MMIRSCVRIQFIDLMINAKCVDCFLSPNDYLILVFCLHYSRFQDSKSLTYKSLHRVIGFSRGNYYPDFDGSPLDRMISLFHRSETISDLKFTDLLSLRRG